MIVPGKEEQIWKDFIYSNKDYGFSELATQMMHTRIKQVISNGGTESEAIEIAYSFFITNINRVENDLKLIIG